MINSISIHPVIIVKWNGNDEWGEPRPPTNVGLRGYIEWRTVTVRDLKGEDVGSSVNVRMPIRRTDIALGRTLGHNDRLVVDGMERAIIAIAEPAALRLPRIYHVFLA